MCVRNEKGRKSEKVKDNEKVLFYVKCYILLKMCNIVKNV